MALREVLAKFGVEVDSEKLEGLDHKIAEVTEKLKGFGEIIAASFIGERLHEFIEEQIRLGDELQDTSERLGVTVEELQRFQLAAGLSGMSTEEATTSLRFFNRTMGNLTEGGGELKQMFAKMHIDTKTLSDDSVPLVEKIGGIADGFSQLKTHGEKTAFVMRVFGRGGAAMIPVLSEGREKVEELFNEFDVLGGGMSKEFTEAANQAEHSTKKLKFALQGLKSRIAVELIPGAKALTDRIVKWVVGFIDLAKKTNVLKTSIIALKLTTFVLIISKIAKMMGMAEGGVVGFIKSLIKLGPIALLALALYLIFDDLYTLFTGGQSVIGGLIDELFGIGTTEEVVQTVNEAWHEFLDWLGGGGSDILKDIARFLVAVLGSALNIVTLAVQELGYAFKFAFDTIAGSITDADKDLDKMKKFVGDFDKRETKLAKWSKGIANPDVEVGKIQFGPQPNLPARQAKSVATGAAATGVQKIEINNHISGVSDPKEAGKHAGRMTRESVGSKDMRDAFAAVGGH